VEEAGKHFDGNRRGREKRGGPQGWIQRTADVKSGWQGLKKWFLQKTVLRFPAKAASFGREDRFSDRYCANMTYLASIITLQYMLLKDSERKTGNSTARKQVKMWEKRS